MRPDSIKDRILEIMIRCAPNYVREEIILQQLGEYDSLQVKKALDALVQDSKLEQPYSQDVDRHLLQGGYSLPSYENIPIRKTIKIGDSEIFRILMTDLVKLMPEDFNQAIESLSEYAGSLENRFRRLVDEEMKRYYGNLITLFGIFIAIFSLIIVALPRISYRAEYGFWKILLETSAQTLPVALILAIFVLVLVKIFRSSS